MRGSRTVAERRAASSSSSARGSSAAITCSATCRSRMRSCARQNRPPPLSLSRSTSRYRSASTSPARVACGTVLPSGLQTSPEVTHRKSGSGASSSGQRCDHLADFLDPQQPREDQEQQHVDRAHGDQPDRGDHEPGILGQPVEHLGHRERQPGRQPGRDQPAGRRRPAAGGCAARPAGAAAAGTRRPRPRRTTRRRRPRGPARCARPRSRRRGRPQRRCWWPRPAHCTKKTVRFSSSA